METLFDYILLSLVQGQLEAEAGSGFARSGCVSLSPLQDSMNSKSVRG